VSYFRKGFRVADLSSARAIAPDDRQGGIAGRPRRRAFSTSTAPNGSPPARTEAGSHLFDEGGSRVAFQILDLQSSADAAEIPQPSSGLRRDTRTCQLPPSRDWRAAVPSWRRTPSGSRWRDRAFARQFLRPSTPRLPSAWLNRLRSAPASRNLGAPPTARHGHRPTAHITMRIGCGGDVLRARSERADRAGR